MNCDIYNNVLNITSNCVIDVMGTEIETPCIPACIIALQYAAYNCKIIYGQSELLKKIIFLLKSCRDPLIKERFFQSEKKKKICKIYV